MVADTLDKKMALLRLNAMRKFIANVKHHIYARIYTDVKMYTIFTAYVKYKHIYIHVYATFAERVNVAYIYVRIYHMFARTRCGIIFTRVSKYDLPSN